MTQDLVEFFQELNCVIKIKGAAYVMNLDEYPNVGTRCMASFCKRSEIVYINSFGAEHFSEEIKEFNRKEKIIANIFRVQANNSIICGYFCIWFINFLLAGKKLTGFTSTFSPHNFKKNDSLILSYFKDEWNSWNKFDWSNKI